MRKSNEIEVKVKAKLDVDVETAFACMKLAAIYANNNGLIIKRKQREDGEYEYSFIDS